VNDTSVLQGLLGRVQGGSTVVTTSEPTSSTPEPPAPSSSVFAPASQQRTITPGQSKFIRDLLAERQGVERAEQVREELNVLREAGGISFSQASNFIDRLKSIPKATATGPQVHAPRTNRYGGPCTACGKHVEANDGLVERVDGAWEVYHRDGECPTAFPFPEGRYAVDNEQGATAFYHCHEDEVWAMASDSERRIPRAQAVSIIAKIAEDPRSAAVRYAEEFKRCGICNRGLTDKESQERGIGPVCARKAGWL
jgi:hypothetical protein